MGAVLLILFFVYSSLRSSFADDNLRNLDKILKDQGKSPLIGLTNSQAKPENIKKIIKAKRAEIESKKEVIRLDQMSSALDVLKGVSGAIPGRPQLTLDIRHLNIDGERMSIEGYVNSKAELDTIQRNLGAMPFVNRLTMGAPGTAVNGKLPFSLSVALNRLPAAEKKK